MPWEKIVPPAHQCHLPGIDREEQGTGSIWKCKCGARFAVADRGWRSLGPKEDAS